jgi:MFS family permease
VDNGQSVGSWRELGRHLGTAVVVAGGVLLGAVNIYLAASLLPTAVEDIGGERLYAWNMTMLLAAQVVATMVVGRVLSRYGNVGAYLVGFGVFAAGSLVCATSPAMSVLLVGRGIQGLGAGLLIGLGFATIHAALPRHLWTRGSALVSAMFGVGNFVGPAVGGLFAQLGSWRLAFVVLAGTAVAVALPVLRVLPRSGRNATRVPVPVVSLLLVMGAVGAVGVAGIVTSRVTMAAFIAVALAFVLAFLWRERSAAERVLPRATYQPGTALPWVYLTVAVLASGVAVETFLPLFGQRLGGLPPIVAGFFGAALSLGWAVSQIASSSARRHGTIRMLQVAGPGVLATGFAGLALLQREDASLYVIAVWLFLLLVGGAGIGLAMPHLSVAAMTSSSDPDEGRKAAASIATVLTMSTALGAALAGLLVNLGAPSMVASARCLLAGFAVVAAVGVLTALRASSPVTAPAARSPRRW